MEVDDAYAERLLRDAFGWIGVLLLSFALVVSPAPIQLLLLAWAVPVIVVWWITGLGKGDAGG